MAAKAPTHTKAAVIGDTVGDPFKDTAGPSLNTMITVTSLVESLFAALIVQYNLIEWLQNWAYCSFIRSPDKFPLYLTLEKTIAQCRNPRDKPYKYGVCRH